MVKIYAGEADCWNASDVHAMKYFIISHVNYHSIGVWPVPDYPDTIRANFFVFFEKGSSWDFLFFFGGFGDVNWKSTRKSTLTSGQLCVKHSFDTLP